MKNKLRIIWETTSDIYIVPDAQVEKKVAQNIKNFHENNGYSVWVGAEIILLGFRVAVKEKKISHKDIVFIFDGIEYSVNADGRFTSPVVGFTSIFDNFISRLF